MFITFEGIEGSGKTTQIQRCAAFLRSKGYDVVQTREPGGTAFGRCLRQLILDPQQSFRHAYTEVLLFYADRLEHIETVIRPALSEGKMVVCDRYVDSTIAYQMGGRGISMQMIDSLNHTIDLWPDHTILLDLDAAEGILRAKKRAALDRFEHETLSFHESVRQAYLDQAKKYPKRIRCFSVQNLNPDAVFSEIRPYLESIIGASI